MTDENIKYAREVVGQDPMASFLGIRVEKVEHAYCRLSLRLKPEYLNALKRAHGIVISAVVDQAVAVASNTTGYQALVIELKINFLGAAAPEEVITAEAKPLDLKRKLSLWQVEVTGSRGGRIALAQALAYHRGQKDGADVATDGREA
jgi:acyl-CoA thioesterase